MPPKISAEVEGMALGFSSAEMTQSSRTEHLRGQVWPTKVFNLINN
jgi:hypothetical protein